MTALAVQEPVDVVRPQVGPQEDFHASPADIVIYGGGAGGGKSWSLVYEAGRHTDKKGYGAIIFRRTSPELTGSGSLWEEALGLYPSMGGVPIRGLTEFRWPETRGLVRFSHMQLERDKLDHQGKQYAFVGFDELTHFVESQFWYLVSRNRSTCGIRPYVRATCNPTPDGWVKKLIAWYLDDEGEYVRPERSGVVRWFYRIGDELSWGDTREELEAKHPEMCAPDGNQIPPTSFTFIEAKLEDNAELEKKDPGYRSRLLALPRVDRERLLKRNWKIRPSAGLYFQRSFFGIVDRAPHDIEAVVRAWDKAATEATVQRPDPDWTRGVKMARTKSGQVVVLHVEGLRGSPKRVEDAIKRCADQDGCTVALWQDPAAAGVADIAHMRTVLIGHTVDVVRASKDKVTYAGPYSTQAEGGNVVLVRGPWNDEYLDELESFPDGAHDDQVDASSLAFMFLFGSTQFAADQWLATYGGKQ